MRALELAGVSSAAVAVLHLAIVFVGGPAYRYFGAGERMARMAERGLAQPTLITFGLALLFAVWAAYAFSGAGLIRRLPLLRPALVVIGVVYTLRGVLLGPQLVWFIAGPRLLPARQLAFSAAALVTGLAYLIGARSPSDRPIRPGTN